MKKIFFCLTIFSVCFSVFGQNKINADYISSYRQALIHYENREYGKSIKFAEDAIRLKKENVEKEAKKLENSLATKQVKSAGDEIDDVIEILKLRDEHDCVQIIEYYTSTKGYDYFHNSVKELVSYIKTQEQYPEAYKLLGDIYKLEGEFSLAEDYYKKAWTYSEVLDVPDQKFEILYLLTDLSRLTGDEKSMEVRLLNIADKETIEKRNILIKSMIGFIKKDKPGTLEKFFQMYRFDDYYSLNAYCQLSEYYLSVGEKEKALGFSCLAVITGFTKMEYIMSRRDITYEYKDLQTFLEEVANYYDLVTWGNKNNIWKSFDLMCELSSQEGGKQFSLDLLKILARYSPNEYWQNSAVIKLDSLN